MPNQRKLLGPHARASAAYATCHCLVSHNLSPYARTVVRNVQCLGLISAVCSSTACPCVDRSRPLLLPRRPPSCLCRLRFLFVAPCRSRFMHVLRAGCLLLLLLSPPISLFSLLPPASSFVLLVCLPLLLLLPPLSLCLLPLSLSFLSSRLLPSCVHFPCLYLSRLVPTCRSSLLIWQLATRCRPPPPSNHCPMRWRPRDRPARRRPGLQSTLLLEY